MTRLPPPSTLLAPTRWLEVSVAVDGEGAEAVAALLHDPAYGGVAISAPPPPDAWSPAPSTLDPPPCYTVTAYLLDGPRLKRQRRRIEEGIWHLGQLWPLGPLEMRWLEEGWEEAWREHFTVLHVGRLVVRPSWLDYAPAAGEEVVLLDPGLAFGTGLHPSTRLCLQELERRLRPGDRVLDLGTGSGLLAIAAVRLGAAAVLALDTDLLAVAAARDNAGRNGTEAIVVAEGSLAPRGGLAGPARADAAARALWRGRFQMAVVNISAEADAGFAGPLARALAPGGCLVASGFVEGSLDRVMAALAAAGLTVEATEAEADWRAAVATKPSTPKAPATA